MAARWSLVALLAAGCGDHAGPTPEDFALAADGLASIDSEASVLAAIELPLSGDFVITTMSADEEHPVTLDRIARNSVMFATSRLSAGCLAATGPEANTVTYTLTSCAVDGHTASGTVVSTFQLIDSVHVTHESDDLVVDGRPVRLVASVEGFLAGGIETRRRTLAMQIDGELVTGAWVATLDPAAGCGTKSGRTTAAFEGSRLERIDTELAWCGDGVAGTLTAGVVQLARGATSVGLELLGDDRVVLDGDGYTLATTISELRD